MQFFGPLSNVESFRAWSLSSPHFSSKVLDILVHSIYKSHIIGDKKYVKLDMRYDKLSNQCWNELFKLVFFDQIIIEGRTAAVLEQNRWI